MQTVREQLKFDGTIDEGLRKMWEKNQTIAKQNTVVLQPVQFAKMVADQNFAELTK